MRITVNGQDHVLGGQGSLADLLGELHAKPEHVAIMVNDRIIPRAGRDEVRLQEGDLVEVLTFMGGG